MPTLMCSDCDIEMTRHAVKVVAARKDTDAVDAVLGGVVLERHACPGCGCSDTSHPSAGDDEPR